MNPWPWLDELFVLQHDAPIRTIAAIQEASCVVTGSWDKTVKYWDTRSPTPMATLQLSERVYAMDVKHPLLVVATADRLIHVVDIRKPSQIYKSIQSNLKFQTRTVACFPDASGFAVGSIEGRCAIQHVEEKDKRNDFAFKCHRDGADIYPVSSIAFHPFGTFSTTGGDGTFCFWDKDARQKLKAFAKWYDRMMMRRRHHRTNFYCDEPISLNVVYCFVVYL